MMMNLKLKEGINPDILKKYGFKPKYNCDTGEVEKYILKIQTNKNSDEYFKFEVFHIGGTKLFSHLNYEAWLSGYTWGNLVNSEFLSILFSLIKDDIIELVT